MKRGAREGGLTTLMTNTEHIADKGRDEWKHAESARELRARSLTL